MARDSFEAFRSTIGSAIQQTGYDREWAVVGGFDERGYVLIVQKSLHEKEPMVRVGCRYFTLAMARRHYISKPRTSNATTRATARRMLVLIDIAVAHAKRNGWLGKDVKFNPTPRKVRR